MIHLLRQYLARRRLALSISLGIRRQRIKRLVHRQAGLKAARSEIHNRFVRLAVLTPFTAMRREK